MLSIKCKTMNELNMDKKIRVLFVSHDAFLGGAELSLLLLVSGINKSLVEPHILAPKQGPLVDEFKQLNLPVHIVPIKRWIPFAFEWARWDLRLFLTGLSSRVKLIKALIEEHDIDIVYTNTVTVIDGAIAAYVTKKPHIWHAREYLKGNKDIKPYIPYALIPSIMVFLSDKIIVNSNSLAQHLNPIFFKKKLTVVYNSADLSQYTELSFKASGLRNELGIDQNKKIIAYVGCLSERKDLITLIKAARIIKNDILDAVFIFVGEGEASYKDKLLKQVDALDLQDDVFFLGSRKDIPAIMFSIDILLLSSRQEAFGKVIIEAMAAEKPVVATCSGGPEEIVVEGETGFLVPVGDEGLMAEKAISLLSNPSLSMKFGMAGKVRVLKYFSYNNYISSIEGILKVVSCK